MNRNTCLLLVIVTLFFAMTLPAQTRHKLSPAKPAASKTTSAVEIPPQYRDLLDDSSQALLVTTPDWNAVDGTLRHYEKKGDQWQEIGVPIPVVVGKNGLAWDGAIESAWDKRDPVKKEGDGRSPAGIFRLTEAFGYSHKAVDRKTAWEELKASTECVDDPSSNTYNQIVDREQVANPDWISSEKMRTIDVYELGLVVDYNRLALPGAGSCIFVHIWNGPGNGTAGCTAMRKDKLENLVDWLDSSQKPVLIQLPAATYATVKTSWNLP